jgi:hypothetical protein
MNIPNIKKWAFRILPGVIVFIVPLILPTEWVIRVTAAFCIGSLFCIFDMLVDIEIGVDYTKLIRDNKEESLRYDIWQARDDIEELKKKLDDIVKENK